MRSIVLLLIICFSSNYIQAQKKKIQGIGADLLQNFEFRCVGPNRGGRVTAVSGIISKPGTFYMGATGGGVWKTMDYGVTWRNVSDNYFATPSIGDINVVQSNPNIIYVGTGSDGIRSNVISGKGVYKSEDAGQTWKHIGLEKVGQIGAVEIHPENPQIVFVAAIGQAFQANKERGVFRTMDGGEHWEKVLYHSDTVGAVDLEFAPDNPNIIYASLWRVERKPWTIISGGYQTGGIYKSTDGGVSWVKKEKGLPQGLIGKIDLAVSPQNPDIVYALVEAPKEKGGLYISHNRGESFEFVENDYNEELLNRPFYFCNIEANPQNAQSLYALADDFFKSTDGGKHWHKMSTPHGDNHDMWINPNDTLIYIESNDGGACVTVNGGITYSTQFNQPTAELYQVEVDDQYPYWIYGGQQDQDNASIAIPSLPSNNALADEFCHLLAVGGCETGPVVPKPGNHNIIYTNCKGRFGVYNKLTGQEKQYYVGASYMYGHNPKDLKYRFQRVAPIHISPHTPNVIYHASQYLHKTTDEGITWETISPDLTAFTPETQIISGSPITRDITGEEFYSAIYSVRESPLKEGLIWVGSNDGLIHVTLNGGSTWENKTPENLPAGGRVDCIEPSSHRESKAYVSVLRYQLGDWRPYIYKTEDFGRSWELLTTGKNGIPVDYPSRVVREDPDQEGLLYAGTEYGLFISRNDGKTWIPFQQNLPVTPISDIKVFRKDLIISTMGRSFWIMDNISPLHHLGNIRNVSMYLFKPANTYRFRYSTNTHRSVPHYPEPGVIIDYYLKQETGEEVLIEILDSGRNVIRTYSSVRQDSLSEPPHNSSIFSKPGSSFPLDDSAGLHRFRWDLKHYGPWDKEKTKSYNNGPLVAPGKYSVILRIGRNEYEQPFSVLKDPRITDLSQKDLKLHESLTLQVRNLLDSAKRLAYTIELRRKEIEKSKKESIASIKACSEEDAKLENIEKQLVTLEGTYMTPKLIDQLNYLGSMLNKADQIPGADAYERYYELKKRYGAISVEYQSIQKSRN